MTTKRKLWKNKVWVKKITKRCNKKNVTKTVELKFFWRTLFWSQKKLFWPDFFVIFFYIFFLVVTKNCKQLKFKWLWNILGQQIMVAPKILFKRSAKPSCQEVWGLFVCASVMIIKSLVFCPWSWQTWDDPPLLWWQLQYNSSTWEYCRAAVGQGLQLV